MDIIFSAALILVNIYLFFLIGAESPAATATELGAAFWPKIIIVLMTILVATNLYKQLKEGKGKEKEKIDVAGFFKSKLFIGMIIVVVMTLIMPYIGFMGSSILFLIAYGYLLGQKNIVKLIINSLIITLILYIVFQGILEIRLERGIGIFRDISLMFEGIILNIRRAI